MPSKAERHRSLVQRRNMLLSLMRYPITMQELCDITGLDYTTVNYHLVIMENENGISYVQEVEKISYRHKLRKTYIALKFEYQVKAMESVEVKEDEPLNETPHIRKFSLSDEDSDYAHNYKKTQAMRNAQRVKQNVWIGSTAAMV
jgi:predicted transcriptional regulator